MSRKNRKHSPKRKSKFNPRKFLQLLAICIGSACVTITALSAFIRVYKPNTVGQFVLVLFLSFCIFWYLGLDVITKCKKHKLIDNNSK